MGRISSTYLQISLAWGLTQRLYHHGWAAMSDIVPLDRVSLGSWTFVTNWSKFDPWNIDFGTGGPTECSGGPPPMLGMVRVISLPGPEARTLWNIPFVAGAETLLQHMDWKDPASIFNIPTDSA
jgi:hypothetical protein